MANWDNKKLLLNYIRYSFIIGDDTGVCESVLERPDAVERPGWMDETWKERQERSDIRKDVIDDDFTDDDDEEFSIYKDFRAHSPDIKIELGKRRKSEISKRLESLRQQRHDRSQISAITCENAKKIPITDSSSGGKVTDLKFEASTNGKFGSFPKPKSSLVSQIIDSTQHDAVNPFQEYSQYDSQGTVGGKQLTVFLHSQSESDIVRIPICISTNAKVRDLIGLVCFHYTKKGYKPDLRSDVRFYDLRVAEDDGQVDSALPPWSPAENVSRFHFPTMALVEKRLTPTMTVNVHTVNGQVYTFPVDQDHCLMTVRDTALEKFRSTQIMLGVSFIDMPYQLEKLDEYGTGLPLDKPISWARTNNFYLLRQNSVRPDAPTPDSSSVCYEMATEPIMSFLNFQSYQLSMIQKSREIDVTFELQKDLIEIRGSNQTNKKNRWRNFRMSMVTDRIPCILHIPYVNVTKVKIEDRNDQALLLLSFAENGKKIRQRMKRFRGRSSDLNELLGNLKKNIKLSSKENYKNIELSSLAKAVSTVTLDVPSAEISYASTGCSDVGTSIHSKKSLFRKFQSVMNNFRSNR